MDGARLIVKYGFVFPFDKFAEKTVARVVPSDYTL